MIAMSKLNAVSSSAIAMNEIAMATTPKSAGPSSRARISVLMRPKLRSTSLNNTIQMAPVAMLRRSVSDIQSSFDPCTPWRREGQTR